MDDASQEAIQSPDDILQSVILDVNGVLESIPGKEERGYFDHAIRVREIIEGSEFGNNEGLLLAAGIHDAVAYALDNDNDAAHAIWDILADGLEAIPEQRDTVRYAIGIALSAHEWEERSEQWRTSIGADLRVIADGTHLNDHAEQTKRYIDETYPDCDASEVAYKVHSAVIDSRTPVISDTIRRFNVGITDAGQMLHDLKVHDIEGLILKAAENNDNIHEPNPDRPASQWQDINETLNYLVPALEFAGLCEYASDIREGALYKLCEDDPLRPNAEQAVYEATILKSAIDTELSTAVDSLGGFTLINQRFKSPGSRIESIRTRMHEPADEIGYRYVIEDMDDQAVIAKARELQAALAEFGFEVFHPRGDDDAFEAFIGADKRNTEYEAVHMTFRYTAGSEGSTMQPTSQEAEISTTIEIQVMTESGYENNETRASHTLYKAIYGADDLSQSLGRRARGEATKEDWDLIEKSVDDIAYMRARKDYFTDKDSSTILQAHTLSKLARIEQLREADPILQIISQMDVAGVPDSVISPTVVTPELFEQFSQLLMPNLWSDEEFQSYYKLAKFVHEGQPRNDGITGHFEGHILPATLALMYKMALTSEFDDQVNFKEWIILILWHDVQEDFKIFGLKDDPRSLAIIQNVLDTMPDKRRQSLDRLTKLNKKMFERGERGSFKREQRSIDQLELDEEIVKIFERMNNLRTDLERFDEAVENDTLTEEFCDEMTRYFHKSVYVLRIMENIGIMKAEKDWLIKQYRKRGILPLN